MLGRVGAEVAGLQVLGEVPPERLIAFANLLHDRFDALGDREPCALGSGGGFWAPGTSSPGIAKWDGTAWSAMDSGLNGEAYVVAVSGKDLYVGGNFTIAGGKVSAYIARAYLPTLPTLSLLPSGNNVSLSWPSPDTSDFLLEQTDTLNPRPTWLANSAPITDDGTNKSITLPATNSSQFFRLRRP